MYENHLSSGMFLKIARQKGKALEEVLNRMHGIRFPWVRAEGSAHGRTDL